MQLKIDPRDLKHRKDWIPSKAKGIEDLALDILDNGIVVPVLVRKEDDGSFRIVDGELRVAAYLFLNEGALDISPILVEVEEDTKEESVIVEKVNDNDFPRYRVQEIERKRPVFLEDASLLIFDEILTRPISNYKDVESKIYQYWEEYEKTLLDSKVDGIKDLLSFIKEDVLLKAAYAAGRLHGANTIRAGMRTAREQKYARIMRSSYDD